MLISIRISRHVAFLARLDKVQEELLYYPRVGVGVSKKFNVKVFYVFGKALSGELSCPCDRSCFRPLWQVLFQAQIRLKCYFFLLINVTMPTAVGIYNANSCWHFNIYEQEKFYAQLSWAWNFFITSGVRSWSFPIFSISKLLIADQDNLGYRNFHEFSY